MIRKPAAFISTISDERGQELMYAGMPISEVFKENIGIGGVVSLLWFKRREYVCCAEILVLIRLCLKVFRNGRPSSSRWSSC